MTYQPPPPDPRTGANYIAPPPPTPALTPWGKPYKPKAEKPEQGLYNAALWTLLGSLLIAPLAIASLILSAMLAGRGREKDGALFMCLSVGVLVLWWLILTGG